MCGGDHFFTLAQGSVSCRSIWSAMDEAVSHSSATSTSNSKADNALRASIEELFFADYGEIARFYRQLEMRSMANALFLPRTLRCAACCSAPRAALRRTCVR